MTNRMLLAYSLGCRITIRFREQVFTNQTFDMTSVPWYLLVSYHVVGATSPILCKSALVSKNLLVFVYIRCVFITVQTTFLRGLGIQSDRMLSSIIKNFSFDLSRCGSKPLVLARNMACVTREIFFSIIRWSCKSSHFNFNLFINLNYFILVELKRSYNS